ncbi:MAG: cyclic nucleotide-binding domain-containing protein [Nitrospina sp.]|jgi:CRP/FNR family transcriptional regulator, cyclic AMP receptor protein|nr:cyclic nucleotide-binding domain-containing protein [Nitrospina sp.]
MDQEQALELIEKLSFFDDFTEKEKHFLSTLGSQIYKYLPSDTIIQEGEKDYSFFILLKGVVAIVKSNPTDKTITKLKAGSVFGEIAYVAKRERTTSVIADGDVIALKIDTKDIDTLRPEIPTKLKAKLIEILVTRLESMNEQVTRNF